jgi:hypothetical protein
MGEALPSDFSTSSSPAMSKCGARPASPVAIASNLGHAPMTKEDRKRIAEYLYGEREWTMQRIAEALDVHTATVARDLGAFSHDAKTSRPKGGRPKSSGKKSGARRFFGSPAPVTTPSSYRMCHRPPLGRGGPC